MFIPWPFMKHLLSRVWKYAAVAELWSIDHNGSVMLRHISDTVMKENDFKCFAAKAFVCRLSKNVYTIYSFQSRHFGIAQNKAITLV